MRMTYKMKRLIIILMLGLVFLTACGHKNVSRVVCNELQQKNLGENVTIRYDVMGRCIVEEKQYDNRVYYQCPRGEDYYLLLVKTDEKFTQLNLDDCEVREE